MKIEVKSNCPLNSFQPCRHNPNTGAEVDEWACAIAWLPMLLIENSQQQRQTGAAVESFRNEMVKANEVSQQVLLAAATATPKLIGGI